MILYVGRFTEVKRIPLLIEAYERARPGFKTRAPLVIVGGFPGEWEGEHPYDAIRRTHARDVFLAGWHDHSRAGRHPRRLRRARAAVRARAVRPGDRGGDGLRRAADRGRRVRAGGHRRPRPDGLAGPARRRRPAWPTRSSRPSTGPASGAGAGPTPRSSRTSATPGPRWPSRSPRSTKTRADATSLRENAASKRLNTASDAALSRSGVWVPAEATATVFAPFRALGWGFASPHPSPAYA